MQALVFNLLDAKGVAGVMRALPLQLAPDRLAKVAQAVEHLVGERLAHTRIVLQPRIAKVGVNITPGAI